MAVEPEPLNKLRDLSGLATTFRKFLGLAVAGLLLFLAYGQFRKQINRSRSDALLTLQGVIESALSDAAQKMIRECPATGCKTWPVALVPFQDQDRHRLGGESFRMLGPERPSGEFSLKELVEEIGLDRTFVNVVLTDAHGRVIAEWRKGWSGLSRLAIPWSGESKQESGASKPPAPLGEVLSALVGGQAREVPALPTVIPIRLGEDDLDLALTDLRLPLPEVRSGVLETPKCEVAGATAEQQPVGESEKSGERAGDAAGPDTAPKKTDDSPSDRFFLAAIASPWSPFAQVETGALWLGLALAFCIVGIPILAWFLFSRSPQAVGVSSRVLIGAVVLLCLLVIAIGLAAFLAEQRLQLAPSSTRTALAARKALVLDIDAARAVAKRVLGAFLRFEEDLPEPKANTVANCPFLASVSASEIDRWSPVISVTDAEGSHLCIAGGANKQARNRKSREYFQEIGSAPKGQITGPLDVVNQQRGERDWLFGVRKGEEPLPCRSAEDPFGLPDRAFVTVSPRLCDTQDTAMCFVVDERGRIVFSNPASYALSTGSFFALVEPGQLLESRERTLEDFVEPVRFRGSPGIMAVSRVRSADEKVDSRYLAISVASFTAGFERIQQFVASFLSLSLWIWAAPLVSLSLLSRFASDGLVATLLPQREPGHRYLAGAVALGFLLFGGFHFALRHLSPAWAIAYAAVTAFGLPYAAYGVLGARLSTENRWLRWIVDPERVFLWYVPCYLVGCSAFLGFAATASGNLSALRSALVLGPGALLLSALLLFLNSGVLKVSERAHLLRLADFLDAVRDRSHRVIYVAAVGVVFGLLAAQPAVLLGGGLATSLARADRLVQNRSQLASGGENVCVGFMAPFRADHCLLARGFGSRSEERVAALSTKMSDRSSVSSNTRQTVLATTLLLALLGIASAGWLTICSLTFSWGAERGRAQDPAPLPPAWSWSDEDRSVLIAVLRRRFPSWSARTILRRQIAAGLIDNDDGLELSTRGRSIATGLSARVPIYGRRRTDRSPTATATEVSPALVLLFVAVAIPIVLWLLARPVLLGNFAIWASTIASALRPGKGDKLA